jgi:predicted XRE-type DNA-binding protein
VADLEIYAQLLQQGAVLQHRAEQGVLTNIDQPEVSHIAHTSAKPFWG